MKSPVYGVGRNMNHRPKGCQYHASAGSVKMKGKKFKLMSCGCCYCFNGIELAINSIHKKEMKNYKMDDIKCTN
jgi:hypothetical protein